MSSANLAEFKVGEGCFKSINECYEEEKYEEIRMGLESHISGTAGLIPFRFDT